MKKDDKYDEIIRKIDDIYLEIRFIKNKIDRLYKILTDPNDLTAERVMTRLFQDAMEGK